MSEQTENNGEKRDTRFKVGDPGGPGRPILSAEEKIIKKATRELIADYKDGLAEMLPKISPIVVSKALEGDMQAIREIHRVVVGEAPKDLNIGSKDDLPFRIVIKKYESSPSDQTPPGSN